jgi:hypothetical protein
MVKNVMACVSVAMMVGLSGAAQAESLAQKKGREDALKQAEHEIDIVKGHCGAEVKLTFDWETFDGSFDATHTPASAAGTTCSILFRGIQAVCDTGKDGKEAIAKSLKEVRCAYDKTVTPKVKLDLKEGVLHAKLSYQMNSMETDVKNYLMNHM